LILGVGRVVEGKEKGENLDNEEEADGEGEEGVAGETTGLLSRRRRRRK